jgi:hypothetical protein
MWFLNLGKRFISRHILHQHWYTCLIALPVRRNLQHNLVLLSQPLPHLHFNLFVISETFATHLWIALHDKYFHRKQKHFFINISCMESFCPQENAQQNAALRYYTLKHGCHFEYWNGPLNMYMRACYLDCHEAKLCCSLVIHIENLLRPLQLFTSIRDLFTDSPSYFFLSPSSWLFLMRRRNEPRMVLFSFFLNHSVLEKGWFKILFFLILVLLTSLYFLLLKSVPFIRSLQTAL